MSASALALSLFARVERTWLALGFVGLVPWLAALDRVRSWRGALASGLLMCSAFALAVFGWFAGAIRSYTGMPGPLAGLLLLVLAPVLQPQLVVFALARTAARRRGGALRGALIGGCAYVGTEWAAGKLFADTLGHGLYASAWLRQGADLAGAPGLTFALLLENECALAALRALRAGPRRALLPAACGVALLLALAAYGAWRLRQLEGVAAPAGLVRAGIVQADISHYAALRSELGSFDAVESILDAHFALSIEALRRAPLDFLVWPETVYPTTFGAPKSPEGAAFDRAIGAFARDAGVPLVFGAYDVDGGDEFNAAFFLEPARSGPLRFDTYRKALLFPLTERVPTWLDGSRLRRWLPWLGTWKPGVGPSLIPLGLPDGRMLRVAPLICYDAVDPRIALAAARQGADLIVTLSNDSWFASGAGPHLHLVVSAFRSIETRLAQVRATNTGISAAIDATGAIVAEIGVHERASAVASVAAGRAASTLLLAWGDWFGPTAAVAGLALFAAGGDKRRP